MLGLLLAMGALASLDDMGAGHEPVPDASGVEAITHAAPHPSSAITYAAPRVRPHEPPSNFGRPAPVRPQGDLDAEPVRIVVEPGLSVDAYRGQLERPLAEADRRYHEAVRDAEARYDATMGPLDGHWQLADLNGQPLLELLITDDGASLLEGAFRELNPNHPHQRVGHIETSRLANGRLSLSLRGDGSQRVLELWQEGGFWRGAYSEAPGAEPIGVNMTLRRAR